MARLLQLRGHRARPARGGSRSRASAPTARQRADAARRGQLIEHASSRARPRGHALRSLRWPQTARTARNHCVLGQTSGRRAPSHVFCSVFVEDAKSSRNEVDEFNFSLRRRLPQDVCVEQRIGAAGARLPRKHMAWRRRRGAPAGKAPLRKRLAELVLGAARAQAVGKRVALPRSALGALRARGHPGGRSAPATASRAPSPPRPMLASCRLRRSARPVNFVSRGNGADGQPGKQLRRKRIGAEGAEERAGRKRRQCQVVV